MRDDHLQNFCRESLMSLEGKGDSHWFDKRFALCSNALEYDKVYHTFVYEKLQLIFAGDSYPFNNNDSSEYLGQLLSRTLYENEKRMAFLKKHAETA